MIKSRPDNNGCGCFIVLIVAVAFVVNQCNSFDSNRGIHETEYKTEPSQSYSQSQNVSEQNELSEEDKQFLNNSLYTGATPYSDAYGGNYRCPHDKCSGIRVTAPAESDIVVIIKRNNQSGSVIAHGYINAGATYQFDIPDGTYQTFFYYGEGWNPNKIMEGGVKGGFVKDELYSKDNPQEIASGILTYVLQLQKNGNFQTKRSNANEFF